MTLATLLMDYIERCLCRVFTMTAVAALIVGLVILGLYTAFVGDVSVGSMFLGVVLYSAVRAAMISTAIRVQDDDDTGNS